MSSTKASNAIVATVSFYADALAEAEQRAQRAEQAIPAELLGKLAAFRQAVASWQSATTELVTADPAVAGCLKELTDAFDRYVGAVEPAAGAARPGPLHPEDVRRGRPRGGAAGRG